MSQSTIERMLSRRTFLGELAVSVGIAKGASRKTYSLEGLSLEVPTENTETIIGGGIQITNEIIDQKNLTLLKQIEAILRFKRKDLEEVRIHSLPLIKDSADLESLGNIGWTQRKTLAAYNINSIALLQDIRLTRFLSNMGIYVQFSKDVRYAKTPDEESDLPTSCFVIGVGEQQGYFQGSFRTTIVYRRELLFGRGRSLHNGIFHFVETPKDDFAIVFNGGYFDVNGYYLNAFALPYVFSIGPQQSQKV